MANRGVMPLVQRDRQSDGGRYHASDYNGVRQQHFQTTTANTTVITAVLRVVNHTAVHYAALGVNDCAVLGGGWSRSGRPQTINAMSLKRGNLVHAAF